MAVLNPEHLLDQASKLVIASLAGSPRQVDVRRAISAAYYAVFHYVLIQAADEFVGKTRRTENRYALVYRSIDHRTLKTLCTEVKRPIMLPKFLPFIPADGLGSNLQAFATAVIDLQEKRHVADYNPIGRPKTSDALLAIATAQSAITRFGNTDQNRQKAFLTLLLFPPR